MKKLFLFSMAAIMLLGFSACNQEEEISKKNGEMVITLASPDENGTRAVGNPQQIEENRIASLSVIVFNTNDGSVDKRAQGVSPLLIKDLDASKASKRVVVIANATPNLTAQIANINNYSNLTDGTVNVALFEQLGTNGAMLPGATDRGLVMTGEQQANVTANTTTNVSVTIRRVVAKIKLGTVTVQPNTGQNSALLSITGVTMQRVRSLSLLGVGSSPANYLMTTGFNYMGGIMNGLSTVQQPLLQQAAINPSASPYFDPSTYFYVLPGSQDQGSCILMSIYGTYNNQQTHFTFRLNEGNPNNPFIRANTAYTVNVILRDIANGNPDGPEPPTEIAAINVTVTPENWTLVPINVTY